MKRTMETSTKNGRIVNEYNWTYDLSDEEYFYCAMHGKCPALVNKFNTGSTIEKVGNDPLFYCDGCGKVLALVHAGTFGATIIAMWSASRTSDPPRTRTRVQAPAPAREKPQRLWKHMDEMLACDEHCNASGWERCNQYPCDAHVIYEDGKHDCDAEGNDTCPRWVAYAEKALAYLQSLADAPRAVKPGTIRQKLLEIGEQA